MCNAISNHVNLAAAVFVFDFFVRRPVVPCFKDSACTSITGKINKTKQKKIQTKSPFASNPILSIFHWFCINAPPVSVCLCPRAPLPCFFYSFIQLTPCFVSGIPVFHHRTSSECFMVICTATFTLYTYKIYAAAFRPFYLIFTYIYT